MAQPLAENLGIITSGIKELSAALDWLNHSSMSQLKLSVIVCTYNRADLLLGALESLVRQTVAPSVYEILVVDNNSSDGTQEVVRDFEARHANCRCCLELMQGIAFARNRGYKEARADWIVYFDSDELAPVDFLERILYVIETYPFDCFGGVFCRFTNTGNQNGFRMLMKPTADSWTKSASWKQAK